MIIRYILNVLLMISLTILGWFITPLNYLVKGFVRKHNIIPLRWFLNDSEPISNMDIDAGDYGRFKHNFVGFYQQNALRNSHWNLRLVLGKSLKGEKHDVEGEMQLLSTTWNYKVGSTRATYKINNRKYFRISLIKEIGGLYFHYQLGVNDYRYLFKFKMGNIH